MNKNKFFKLLPIIVLILGIVAFFALGGHHYLSLEVIKNNYQSLVDFTADNFVTSCLIFSIAYILVVAFSIPGASVMTLVGGFLFGVYVGSVLVVFSATTGAVIVYLAVKSALGEILKSKAKGNIEKMRNGFENDAFNYLLSIRLVPIFPFFIINIACGMLGVKFRDFFWATLIGIIPGSVIYVWVGTGLGFALKQGEDLNLGIIFQPQFIVPIIALALLSLVPIIYKKYKGAKA